jgi:hypothetical protein
MKVTTARRVIGRVCQLALKVNREFPALIIFLRTF